MRLCNNCGKPRMNCDCTDDSGFEGPEPWVSVPVMNSFDAQTVIGHLKIKRESLPPIPNWTIAIGFTVENMQYEVGELPTRPPEGPYELVTAAIVLDKVYSEYLEQTGVKKAEKVYREDASKYDEFVLSGIYAKVFAAIVVSNHSQHAIDQAKLAVRQYCEMMDDLYEEEALKNAASKN